jgi:hypothetical protein
VLDALSKSWNQNPSIALAQADPDGTLRGSVKALIDECSKTLRELENTLDGVTKPVSLASGGPQERFG